MAPEVTYGMQQDAYRMVAEELQSMDTTTGSCPQLGDPVVDEAVRHILGIPNNWKLTILSVAASFTPKTQQQLATAAAVLMSLTADWDDFDERGLSRSQVRIDEIMGYVDEENVPEDLQE